MVPDLLMMPRANVTLTIDWDYAAEDVKAGFDLPPPGKVKEAIVQRLRDYAGSRDFGREVGGMLKQEYSVSLIEPTNAKAKPGLPRRRPKPLVMPPARRKQKMNQRIRDVFRPIYER